MKQQSGLTQGRILPTLLKFALPVLAALFLQSLYGGVDLLVVGQFSSTEDLSGVATGSLLMQTITMIITGLSVGVTVLLGQKIGEGDERAAGKTVSTGIVLFLMVTVIVTPTLLISAPALAEMLHAPQEAFEETVSYIRICGAGFVFIVGFNVIGAVFRGIGDSKTPLYTVLIACISNILGDLLFVAWLGMGAAGAALATILSQSISVILSLAVILRRKDLPFRLRREDLGIDLTVMLRELKLGTPIALQEFLVGMSFLIIQTIVNNIGVNESAGVGVAEKVCGFVMLVPSAYMQSMAAFVAQNLGAGREERCRGALFWGIATSLMAGIVIAGATFFHGDVLAGIFAKEMPVITAAHSYLKAYAIDTLLTSILFCMMGYYNGCGLTLFVMAQGLIGALGVRVPLSLLISQLPNASIFMIGLATPFASLVQILLCLGMFVVQQRKRSRLHT